LSAPLPGGAGSGVVIRRLTPPDAVPYRNLMLTAYDARPDAFTSTEAERRALPMSWWEGRVQPGCDAPAVVLGAFVNDILTGTAGVSFSAREKARHKAVLFGMYVRPESRCRSVGFLLVDAVIQQAAVRAALVVQLTVSESNRAARRLYERAGFAEYGREPLAMRTDAGFVTKIHMWRLIDVG